MEENEEEKKIVKVPSTSFLRVGGGVGDEERLRNVSDSGLHIQWNCNIMSGCISWVVFCCKVLYCTFCYILYYNLPKIEYTQ